MEITVSGTEESNKLRNGKSKLSLEVILELSICGGLMRIKKKKISLRSFSFALVFIIAKEMPKGNLTCILL